MSSFNALKFIGFERVEEFSNESGPTLTKIRSAILKLPRKNCELAKTPHLDRSIFEHRAIGMGFYERPPARQVRPFLHRAVAVRRSAAQRSGGHCDHSGHRVSAHRGSGDLAGYGHRLAEPGAQPAAY